MAEVITMLALSPTMEEGTLIDWLKGEGDSIAEGEIIAEIETDKATMEMESFHDGTVLKLLVDKGTAIPVGAPLAIIGTAGEDISALLADLNGAAPAAAPAAAEPEPAPAPAASATAATNAAPSAPVQSPATGRVVASPLARRLAEERGIDLSSVPGSGPHGRIVKRDIEQAATAPAAKIAPAPVQPIAGDGTDVPLSQMRKTIARRLGEVWVSTPHFFLTMEIDMARAMAQRKQMNAQLAEAGRQEKISVNDMIVKACGVALERFPAMNVSFQGDHIVQYAGAHVGVAVAVEDGLITPTIRDAHLKPLSRISAETRELAGRARDKRLRPEEYTGGTFSVSNLGMFGIDQFTAIINPPQAGILACGAVQKVPVVVDDELTIGTRMKVTLSCDHRAVDGATGAQFLQEVKKLLENPMLMLI